MKTQFITNRRTMGGMFAAALAFAFVTLMVQMSLSAEDWNDGVKRQKIEDMYSGYKKKFPDVPDLSAQKAINLMADRKTVLIDIREPREQHISMLPGAITEKEFMNNPLKYKDAVKIVYCTISYRSGKFAQRLQGDGNKVYNLKGGILAWVHHGGKIYDQNGETHRIHVYGQKWNLAPNGYQAIW